MSDGSNAGENVPQAEAKRKTRAAQQDAMLPRRLAGGKSNFCAGCAELANVGRSLCHFFGFSPPRGLFCI
eukprot:g35475.t1